jgi:hypothetical protein
VAAEIRGPYAVQIVLLGHVGEESRCRHEIREGAARRLQRLLEVLHREHGLLAHRRRQVELLVAMRMAVVDRGG